MKVQRMSERDARRLAVSIFGDEAQADAWLLAPKRRFEGKSPLAMLTTKAGAQEVVELLEQVRWGMTA